MSDDQNDDWGPVPFTDEEIQAALWRQFRERGLLIKDAADMLGFEQLVNFLQTGSLIGTGRRGSDDQPRAVIQPAAWYRLNIIGDGWEGVARDQYDTVYFDLLIHPGIEKAERTLTPKDEVRKVSPYLAVADQIPHGDMTKSDFMEAFKRECARAELSAPSGRECETQWRRLAPEGGRKRGPRRSRQ